MDIDAHKMFEMVKKGEIALEDFLQWVEMVEDRSRENGYESGKSIGYEVGYVDGKYGY